MIRFISVVLIIFAYGRSQVTENEENCPGSTVNNYILGPDGYTMQPTVYTGESPKQGKPGKRGKKFYAILISQADLVDVCKQLTLY